MKQVFMHADFTDVLAGEIIKNVATLIFWYDSHG